MISIQNVRPEEQKYIGQDMKEAKIWHRQQSGNSCPTFFRLVVCVLYPHANPELSLDDMRCFISKRLVDCSHILYKKT